MCRNIKLLYNFTPPATDDEIRSSALQYVRKLSGMRSPSQANQAAFDRAVDEIADITRRLLLQELSSRAEPRDRQVEAARAKARGRARDTRMRARLAVDAEG